jgi:hypothetical protein
MDNLGYRNWGNTSSSYNDSIDSPVDKYFNKKYDNSSKNKNKQQQPQQQSILTDSYDYDTSNDFIESPVAVASKKDHRNTYNTTATSSNRSNNNTDYGNNKNSTDNNSGSRYGSSTRRVSVDDRAREILERSKQMKLGDSYEDDKSRLKSYEDTLAEFRLGGYIPTESIEQHDDDDDDDDDNGGGVESNGKDVKGRLITYSTASSPDNHHYRRPEDSPLESPFGITDSFEISASDFEVGAIAAKIQERKSKDKLNDRRRRMSFDYSKGDDSHDNTNNDLSVSSSIHHHLKATSSPDISRTAVIGRRNSNNSNTLLIDDRYDANNNNNNNSNSNNLIHNNNHNSNKMQFSTALSSIHKNNTIDDNDDYVDRALHDYNGVRRFGSAERSDDEIYRMLNVTTGTQDSMKFGMNNETSNTLDSNILTETALSAVGGKNLNTKKRSDSQRHPSLGEISDVTQRSSSPTNVVTGHHLNVVGKSDDKYKFNRYGDDDDDDDDHDDHEHDVDSKMKKNISEQHLNDDNDDKNNEDEDDRYSGDSNHAYSPPINHHDKVGQHEDDDRDDEDEYSLDGFETNSPDGKNHVVTSSTIHSTTNRQHHRDDVIDNQQQQQQLPLQQQSIDPFDEIRQRWYNAESSDFLQRLTTRVDKNDNIDDNNNNDISFQIQNKTDADSFERKKDADLKNFNNNDHDHDDNKHHCDNSPSNHSSEAGSKQSNHHTSLTLAKDDDDENDSTLPNSIISNTSRQMKNGEGMLYCTYCCMLAVCFDC